MMSNVKAKMESLDTKINKFLRKYPSVSPADFPLHEFKSLNKELIETHIKMSANGSGINIDEGVKWFRDNVNRLIEFIP